jgi:hypothetical protein
MAEKGIFLGGGDYKEERKNASCSTQNCRWFKQGSKVKEIPPCFFHHACSSIPISSRVSKQSIMNPGQTNATRRMPFLKSSCNASSA